MCDRVFKKRGSLFSFIYPIYYTRITTSDLHYYTWLTFKYPMCEECRGREQDYFGYQASRLEMAGLLEGNEEKTSKINVKIRNNKIREENVITVQRVTSACIQNTEKP